MKKPILFGLSGIAGGLLLPLMLGSKTAFSLVNPVPFAARQALLWERLLPNATFSEGILLALLWAALPALGMMMFVSIKKYWPLHWLQRTALAISMLGFLTVGLIASVKMGGGSNLHNLDMFLLTIVLAAPHALASASRIGEKDKKARVMLGVCLFVGMVFPVSFAMQKQNRPILPSDDLTHEALTAVKSWVSQAAERGEVLFIDHRQLLTFGFIRDVQLVDKYEKKMLMEMAMSGRADYFKQFYADLNARRFQLIVNEPTVLIAKDASSAFSEENNAFVEWVALPLLCNYYPVYTSKETNLELLLPRTADMMLHSFCAAYLTTEE